MDADSNDPEVIAMRAAWNSLLKGDTAGRDRHLESVLEAQRIKERNATIEAEQKIIQKIDFFVFADGRCISSKVLYAVTH